MKRNPVGWFEIYVQDTQRAKAFYETVFETRLEKLSDTHTEMWMFPNVKDGGGAPGALVKMEGVPSGGNSTLVYFSSADCAVEADRAARAGGRVMKGKPPSGPPGSSPSFSTPKETSSGSTPCGKAVGAPPFSPSPRRTVVINFYGWPPS